MTDEWAIARARAIAEGKVLINKIGGDLCDVVGLGRCFVTLLKQPIANAVRNGMVTALASVLASAMLEAQAEERRKGLAGLTPEQQRSVDVTRELNAKPEAWGHKAATSHIDNLLLVIDQQARSAACLMHDEESGKYALGREHGRQEGEGERGRLKDALRMVLIFYASGNWRPEERAEWGRLAANLGQPDATASTKTLLHMIEQVLEGEDA